jgi:hypothetical protein
MRIEGGAVQQQSLPKNPAAGCSGICAIVRDRRRFEFACSKAWRLLGPMHSSFHVAK